MPANIVNLLTNTSLSYNLGTHTPIATVTGPQYWVHGFKTGLIVPTRNGGDVESYAFTLEVTIDTINWYYLSPDGTVHDSIREFVQAPTPGDPIYYVRTEGWLFMRSTLTNLEPVDPNDPAYAVVALSMVK